MRGTTRTLILLVSLSMMSSCVCAVFSGKTIEEKLLLKDYRKHNLIEEEAQFDAIFENNNNSRNFNANRTTHNINDSNTVMSHYILQDIYLSDDNNELSMTLQLNSKKEFYHNIYNTISHCL